MLRPKVSQRGKETDSGTIHISKKKIIAILAGAGTPYSLEEIRRICVKCGPEANADWRSCFATKDQETALKFPRASVGTDILSVIDSCKKFTCLDSYVICILLLQLGFSIKLEWLLIFPL